MQVCYLIYNMLPNNKVMEGGREKGKVEERGGGRERGERERERFNFHCLQ